MIEQLKTIREFFKLPVPHSPQDLGEYLAEKSKAVQAAAQLEAMVGEQEPVYQGALAENVWIDLDKEAHDNWVANKGKVRTTYIVPVAQHAAIERKDALLRQAVELIGSFSAIDICETQHHNKADQHSHIAQCPIAERFRAVWFAIKQELSQ